ncbi:MAG: peptide chain release factor N(5)-glutamine methyltransferase, partial [Myxococcota bacterium]|nr:peptide chain release factor N(5)-glutamine methyltransferase [Myxococcota bacterium]
MSDESWTVLRILQWTTDYLERSGSNTGRLDAEVLLAHVLGCERIRLYVDYARPLGGDERARYRGMVKRRAGGEPVSYITGSKEFWSIPFRVEPGVLIPRPDTEILVEVALEQAERLGSGPLRIADVGTGSGCVAVALAHELPQASVIGGDIADLPLRLAPENASTAGVSERCQIHRADGLRGLWEAAGRSPFDLVVSNPPYLRTDEGPGLMSGVRDHEPGEALFGGDDGLEVIVPMVRAATD